MKISVAFLLLSKAPLGKVTFNRDTDWGYILPLFPHSKKNVFLFVLLLLISPHFQLAITPSAEQEVRGNQSNGSPDSISNSTGVLTIPTPSNFSAHPRKGPQICHGFLSQIRTATARHTGTVTLSGSMNSLGFAFFEMYC